MIPSDLPRLTDEVVMSNEYCTYQNKIPYVKSVDWSHLVIRAAMRGLGPGWRSMFSYSDWNKAYGLEDENSGSDAEQRDSRVRNFIRVLCGEFRDYPAMLRRKLQVVSAAQVYAGPEELTAVDTSKNLFTQITFPAYEKMRSVMGAMHAYRQKQVADPDDGKVYNHGANGDHSGRVENSVPPWTHCEMKFMFTHYMVQGAPKVSSYGSGADVEKPADYEAKYAAYRDSECSLEDLAWMYNFRGHKNFKPLWLESNAFIWNSRRGRKASLYRKDHSYYLHPFAARYLRSRQAWGAYLFHRDEDAAEFGRAYDSGGGPILYITDQDTDGDDIADYRLFDKEGCGDQGVGSNSCNMVDKSLASSTPNTTGHAAGWSPEMFWLPDMGFLAAFGSFADRMARFNQALDRHTNWGPTGYYMIDASKENTTSVQYIGAYSPIVACSYDISASHGFATGNYPSTHPYEKSKTKWMYIMRYPASSYYSEKDMEAGKPFDFDRTFFNETSLSNDFYGERALDRFGFITPEDIHANVYFVYGDRGEPPPALEDIPAP